MQMWRMMAAAGVLFVVQPAMADVVQDCRRSPTADARLSACTEIIKGQQFSADQKAAAFRNRAETRMMAGALNEAIIDFTEAMELNPNNAAILAGRGQARLLAGDLDLALGDYTAAIQMAPDRPSYWIERGHLNLTRGDADAAIADLTEAIRLSPRSASAHNNRGLAFRKKGDLDRAFADYTAALAINPIYALAYANRGYLEAARGRKAEAVADLRAALMLDPSLAGANEELRRLGVADPLSEETARRIQLGKALVEMNCSRCHAVGEVGLSPKAGAPEFRRLQNRHALMALREPLTRGIAAPHDEMPKFAFANADIDNIVAYINSLPMR